MRLCLGRWALGMCGAVLLLAGGSAEASSVIITGSPFGTDGIGPFAGYGGSVNQHNVVGYSPSRVSDPYKGTQWRAQGNATPGAVIANVPYYEVDWYLIGAESGHTNSLYVDGSLLITEHNQNNRLQSGNDPGPSLSPVITTSGSGKGLPIPFSLMDVTNGANAKPGAFIASLMFAYVDPVHNKKGVLKRWRITNQETDWFIFAFDDAGSTNDDFDDFVGIAHVRGVAGPPVTPTPIPGALPLMASAIGGGYLLTKWRRHRRRRNATTLFH